MNTHPARALLSKFPKHDLLHGATPIQELKRLNEQLGGVRVYIKRDDVMGIGLGGSKLRKLEYLVGDALRNGADHIVTVGARQSNHARLTAAAAATAGLGCDLVLTRTVQISTDDYSDNGNIVLDHILGAHITDLPGGADSYAFAESLAAELRLAGKAPYLIPTGGSNAIGCLGYVDCFFEILEQQLTQQIHFDTIVVPNGSSGTHAGLLAAALISESPVRIRSYNVLGTPDGTQLATRSKTQAVLDLLGTGMPVTDTQVMIDNNYRGASYGIPTQEMVEAVTLLARTEGILLDPVYSGKAFAGLLGDIRKGIIQPGTDILFIATGGTPVLFAYRSVFEA